MGALAIIPSSSLPPARATLVALNRRLADADRALATLVTGRDRLRSELGRADVARNELDSMIAEDASSLVGKLRSGANWALSHFGSPRAMNLLASLSESHLQNEVGSKALAAIEAEIAVAEREVADLRLRKPDLVRAVLLESADGFKDDLATAIDDLRAMMVVLAALDKITARSDGHWSPNERVVVEIPALAGLQAQAVVVPSASIETALRVWGKYSQALGDNPLASADEMKFPPVNPHADDGMISYDRLTSTERSLVDQNRSQGVK
jgi:hypothetical protein